MTLVQLRHFISLAQTGSFSKSAEAMHLTQPALSRSIRAIEDELGLPLFDRIGRRSELTPFGRQVLQRAQRLVDDAAELHALGQRMQQGEGGAIRIGLGSGPGALLMTPLLMQVATRHPQLTLEISRGSTDRLVQALRDRQLDALVIDARSLQPATDLRTELVCEIRGSFMVRRGHPLLRKRGGVRFEMLKDYPIASTPLSDEVARRLMETYGPEAHPAACVTLRCEEIPSLVEVVRKSDAILLAVRAAAPDLVELPMVPGEITTALFGLVTLAGRAEAPAMPIVLTLVQELLKD